MPRKNLADFLGHPLLLWQARAAAASGVFDAVIVSSDDDEILSVAEAAGLLAHRRSAEASSDTASSEAVMTEALRWYEARPGGREVAWLCLAQATSPLTLSKDYAAAWELLRASGADSLVTVTRKHIFLWEPVPGGAPGEARPANYDPGARPRRQDWGGVLVENGAFYIARAAGYAATGCRLPGRVVAHEMEEWQAAEIDSHEDLDVCRALAQARGLALP